MLVQSQEVTEGEEMVGLVNPGKLRFVYSAKHNVSIDSAEENCSLLFSSESLRDGNDRLEGPCLNHITGTNSVIDGSEAGISDTLVAARNMVLQGTNNLPFVDTKLYWNMCDKSLSTVYALETSSAVIPMDSKLLLERCLASINKDHLIFSLVLTSQAHEKVIMFFPLLSV